MNKSTKIAGAALVLLAAALACTLGGTPAPIEVDLPDPVSPAPVVQPSEPLPEPTSVEAPANPLPDSPQPFTVDAIEIIRPGSTSDVTAPVVVEGFAEAVFEQTLVIAVYNSPGNLIATYAGNIEADVGQAGPFSTTVDFGVDRDQPGRISVYALSPRDGGLLHLASVNVTLVVDGESFEKPGGQPHEIIDIQSPSALAEVSGGMLTVEGYSDYFFESNLGMMLCGEGGGGGPHRICGTADNVLAESYAMIASPDIGLPGPFSGTITYSVTEPTRARLVVYAVSPRDGNFEHLSAQEVLLKP